MEDTSKGLEEIECIVLGIIIVGLSGVVCQLLSPSKEV